MSVASLCQWIANSIFGNFAQEMLELITNLSNEPSRYCYDFFLPRKDETQIHQRLLAI